MTGPRDWDKELAEIDKLMGKPGNPSEAPAPSAQRNPVPAQPGSASGSLTSSTPTASHQPVAGARPGEIFTVWLKVGLGVLGAGALLVWPYDRTCGILLYSYLAGILAVAGAGIWSLTASWRHRRSAAHGLALLVLLVATVLAAREILPRIGQVGSSLTWTCSVP